MYRRKRKNIVGHTGWSKVSLQLFYGKNNSLINNSTRINCDLCVHKCKPTFAAPCIWDYPDCNATALIRSSEATRMAFNLTVRQENPEEDLSQSYLIWGQI